MDETSVYLYYDQHEILIYVGITSRGGSRQREHNRGKSWWSYVVRQDVEHYPTRLVALAREKELIEWHRPPFNTQHNPDHEMQRQVYELARAAFHGRTAQDVLKAHGMRLPLRGRRSDGLAVFTTLLEVAPVVVAETGGKTAKVSFDDGIGVGQVTKIKRAGMLTYIEAEVRQSLRVDEALAHIRIAPKKKVGDVYELKRVILHAEAR